MIIPFDQIDTSKKVIIAVTQWNFWEMTKKCVEDIRKYTNLENASIVIFDDNSDDLEAIKWINETDEKVIRMESNIHHNAMVRRLQEKIKDIENIEYLCAMNNDIIVTKGWLEICYNAWKRIKISCLWVARTIMTSIVISTLMYLTSLNQ